MLKALSNNTYLSQIASTGWALRVSGNLNYSSLRQKRGSVYSILNIKLTYNVMYNMSYSRLLGVVSIRLVLGVVDSDV